MARLDRLGSAKEVAQIGAHHRSKQRMRKLAAYSWAQAKLDKLDTMARIAVLFRVCGSGSRERGRRLQHLVGAGLLFRQGLPPQATYLFKHAWCRMRLIARCYATPDVRYMPELLTHLKASLPILPRASPNCSRATAPKLARSKRPLASGARRDSGRWSVRLW